MARVLLINPSSHSCYAGLKVSIVDPVFPTLNLAALGATALRARHQVRLLDLSGRPYDVEAVRDALRAFRPDLVGITASTPQLNQLRDISLLVKDLSPQILVIGGGPHPSALPRETLLESHLDAVVVGEGEPAFAEICDGRPLAQVAGVVYRQDGEAHAAAARPPIQDLDRLPMPAWHLYDLDRYRRRTSRLFARRVPFVVAELSRGCVYGCDFCASKAVMGRGLRVKSPARAAEEVRYLQTLGVREFQLADDLFGQDRDWAEQVCEAIGQLGADVLWSCTNGIRVESADAALFRALRRAKCYRVAFGLESGDDQVLRAVGKGGRASIARGLRAIELARQEGIETFGFFMLGLSADTVATMQETIDWAAQLPLDLLKFSRAVPFPGSTHFAQLAARGLVKTFDWDDYHIYSPHELFVHPSISRAQIVAAMDRAYRDAVVFNPRFIGRRLRRGLRSGALPRDLYYFARLLLMPAVGRPPRPRYYGRARWPVYDWRGHRWNRP